MSYRRTQSGLTLVELTLAIAIGALVMAGLAGMVGGAEQARKGASERLEIGRQARLAMAEMKRAIAHTRLLLLPMADNPLTNWPENIREETVPASAPIGNSTKATAVLAVTLPLYSDLDGDGFPDADDDRDGRVDEDLGQDLQKDSAPGILLIDDDGDGSVDEGGVAADNDEDGVSNEDPIDGIDNDADNSIDEDNPNDMNADGCSGLCGVDDDGDGTIDESSTNNASDDEQGGTNEDWYNPVVFYLDTGVLKQRTPAPWDANADNAINGADFVTSTLADNVSAFRVERVNDPGARAQLVDLTLELASPTTGETFALQTRVRVGGDL